MTLFGSGLHCRGGELGGGQTGRRVGSKPSAAGVLRRGEETQTDTRGKTAVRRWRQRLEWGVYQPRIAGNARSWPTRNRLPPRSLRGTAQGHLDLQLLASRAERKYTQSAVLCYSGPRELIHWCSGPDLTPAGSAGGLWTDFPNCLMGRRPSSTRQPTHSSFLSPCHPGLGAYT